MFRDHAISTKNDGKVSGDFYKFTLKLLKTMQLKKIKPEYAAREACRQLKRKRL